MFGSDQSGMHRRQSLLYLASFVALATLVCIAAIELGVAWIVSNDADWVMRFSAIALSTSCVGVVAYLTLHYVSSRYERIHNKQAESERELIQHLETLEMLVGGMGSAVIISNIEGRFLQFSDAARRILGFGAIDRPPDEWSAFYGIFHPDMVTPIPPGEWPLARAMRGEFVHETEIYIRNGERPDGVWCSMTAAPLKDGVLLGGIVVFRDITEQKRSIEALYASENQLRAIVETAADAIITINRAGIVQTFNQAAEKMFGYTANEVIGENVSMLMPAPHRDRHDSYIQRYVETGEHSIIGIGRDLEGQRKDGSIFPLHLAVTEVDHLGIFTGLIRDITMERTLHRSIVNIASEEQQRIGEDLHDGIGQELTGMGLSVDGLMHKLKSPDIANALERDGLSDILPMLERFAQSIQNARRQLRQLVSGLVPLPVGAGQFPQALKNLADYVQAWDGNLFIEEIDESIEIHHGVIASNVYRIAQEALNNAIKHSGADTIRISLGRLNGLYALEIADNGAGFNLREVDKSAKPGERAGVGLSIMEHRARIIGATLSVGPSADGGIVVRCAFRDGT